MARIRSIHPGLFTDENYAVLSFPARELLKGLWTEADDNGIFEWKPLSLKMRIFPADAVDVAALLGELSSAWVRSFEVEGRVYGACKNFCKYQRPKKPKAVHPLPEALKPYIMHGYKPRGTELVSDEHEECETGSPPVLHQFPTGTEKSGQMEDGGWKGKEDKPSLRSVRATEDKQALADFEAFYEAYPRHEGRGQALKAYRTAVKKADPPTLLRAAQRFRARRAGEDQKFTPLPASWLNGERWLDEPSDAKGVPVRLARPAYSDTHADGWRDRVRSLRAGGTWRNDWGPRPGEEGCKCPASILEEGVAA